MEITWPRRCFKLGEKVQRQNPSGMDEPNVRARANLTGTPLPRDIPQAESELAATDTIDWLRKHDPSPDGIDGPTLMHLADLAGAPLPQPSLTPTEKANVLNDALDWIRQTPPKPQDINDPTIRAPANLSGIPAPREPYGDDSGPLLSDAIDWLWNNVPNAKDVDEPLCTNS